jgi:predicted porin
MKKSLLALAVAAALPAVAQAQSSVTLYGILDASVEYSNDDANTALSVVNGQATVGDSTIRLNSGIGSGSRFGVRGVEDLGGGLKAIFTLEAGLNVDTGQTITSGSVNTNAFWARQSWVGLQGGWGQFTAGRQYTPIFWALLPADFTGYGFYNNWGGYTGTGFGPVTPQGPIRLDNALSYKSPAFGGLTVYATYAFGETSCDVSAATCTQTGANSGAVGGGGDIWGLAAGWQWGGLYVGGGYHQVMDTRNLGQNGGGGTLKDVMAIAGSYSFGAFGVSAGYTALGFSGSGEVTNWLGSLFWNVLGGTFYLNGSFIDISGFGGVGGYVGGDGIQVGATYARPLSKRTDWYVAYGYNELSAFTPTAAANSQFNDLSPMRFAVGLRHRF